jgi:predicted ABC-class ATPase
MKNPASTARLEQKVKRLSTLIEVNIIVSPTLNLDQFFENAMAVSKQMMNTERRILMKWWSISGTCGRT